MKTLLNSKDKEIRWTASIEEARNIYHTLKNQQMSIAKLAYDVCEIRHGGNVNDNLFTIKRFAEEAKLSEKALNNWVIVYRNVYLKLPEEIRVQTNITKLNRIALRVRKDDSDKYVTQVAKKILSMSDVDESVMRYCYDLRAITNSIKDGTKFTLCSKRVLEEFKFYVEDLFNATSKKLYTYTTKNNSLMTTVNTLSSMHGTLSDNGSITNHKINGYLFKDRDEKLYRYILKTGKVSQSKINNKFDKWRYASIRKLVNSGLVTNKGNVFYTNKGN